MLEIIDLTPPLAGKTLIFDVKVLSVEPAKPPDRKPKDAKPSN